MSLFVLPMFDRVLGWLLPVSADIAILSEQLLDVDGDGRAVSLQLPLLRHRQSLLLACLEQVFVPLEF